VKPPEVVISYARADLAWVEKLHAALRAAGVETWYDQHLRVGDPWRSEVEDHIRAARFVLVVVSKASVRSNEVGMEIEYARQLGKPQLPIRIDDVDMPLALANLQVVDAFDRSLPLAKIFARIRPGEAPPLTAPVAWVDDVGRMRGRVALALAFASVLPAFGWRSARFRHPSELGQFLHARAWVWFDPSELELDEYGAPRWPSVQSIASDLDRVRDAGFGGIVTSTALGPMANVPRLARELGLATVLGVWDPLDRRELFAAIQCGPLVDGYCIGRTGLSPRYASGPLAEACSFVRHRTGRPTSICEAVHAYDEQLTEAVDWLMPDAHIALDRANGANDADAVLHAVEPLIDIARKRDAPLAMVVPYPHSGIPGATRQAQGEFFARLTDELHHRDLARMPVLIAQGAFDAPWKRPPWFTAWDPDTGLLAGRDAAATSASAALTAWHRGGRGR
jgi:nucleotide-binding universal stress UspA family protein